MPEEAKKCVASWKKYCPDYEVVRWDETNFDLRCNRYVQEAYQAKNGLLLVIMFDSGYWLIMAAFTWTPMLRF